MAAGASEAAGALAASPSFWAHWGFEPWREGPLAGVARRQNFVKDGFLGEIASFKAWDYIVWQCGDQADREALWRGLKPIAGVMTQRFLFLLPDPAPKRRIKSFWLGFRGYGEFFEWHPGHATAAPADLTGLISLCWEKGKKC